MIRLRAAAAAVISALVLLPACSSPLPHFPLLPGARTHAVKVLPSPGSIEAFVPEAESYVEKHRGLKFKTPVAVKHLSDAEFGARVAELQRQDPAELARQAKVLRALSLVPPDLDVEKAEETLLSAQVIGYYDPKTKELVVRGTAATAAVKHVVVHELTHALQDQWFDLAGHQDKLTDDAAAAYVSLVEGDAVRIERGYIMSLPAADRRDIQNSGGGPAPQVPQVLLAMLSFPYIVGPNFVNSVIAARGQAGLDAAFKEPPSTTSQVIHPERYIGGTSSPAVADPPADGTPVDHGVMGELGLQLLLGELLGSPSVPAAALREATQGWAGDRYVGWSDGSGYCVRDRFAESSPAAGQALVTVLRSWALNHKGARVDAGDQPVLTACA